MAPAIEHNPKQAASQEHADLSLMYCGGTPADYYRLDEKLETLMTIVPPAGSGLERTTMLTWLYRQNGVMRFLDFCDACEKVSTNVTTRKRQVRRVLKGMWRIGAVQIHTPEGLQNAEGPTREGEIALNRYSTVLMATGGMIWLQRAWQARAASMRRHTARITEIHNEYLAEEEEEGRSGDPYWLQKFAFGKEAYVHGEQTAWMGAGINSVFSISQAIWSKPQTKTTRRARA